MRAVSDPDELTGQTCREESADSLYHLQTGLVLVLLGGLGAFFLSSAGSNLYLRALAWNRELAILGLVAIPALFVLLTIGARRGLEHLRWQVLRQGSRQAVPRRVQVRWQVMAAVTGIAVILIVAALVLLPVQPLDLSTAMRVLAAVSDLGTSIPYVAVRRELRLQRLQWVDLAGRPAVPGHSSSCRWTRLEAG